MRRAVATSTLFVCLIALFGVIHSQVAHAASTWDFIRVYEKSMCKQVGQQMVREKPYVSAYRCDFFRNDQYKLYVLIRS